jgi:hypothetical protein
MTTWKGRCSHCGTPLELAVPEAFAGAEVFAPLCPACTDRMFLDEGGAVLMLERDVEGALFSLGKITVTAGAVDALSSADQHAFEFLARHACGDWGSCGQHGHVQLTDEERAQGCLVTDDSAKINKSNLINRRGEIMSAYVTSQGKQLWIITRLGEVAETTILLPSEY